MTPAQAQYGQFGQSLPHTGVNLTLIAGISLLLILGGLFLLFHQNMKHTPRGRV